MTIEMRVRAHVRRRWGGEGATVWRIRNIGSDLLLAWEARMLTTECPACTRRRICAMVHRQWRTGSVRSLAQVAALLSVFD